jgi:predicted nucleotidyltransferase
MASRHASTGPRRTRPSRAPIEGALRSYFAGAKPGLIAAWLFGSVARGTAAARSDVDVALLFRRDPPRTLAGRQLLMASELEEILKRPVDVVVLNHASCDLVHRVLRDGRLLLDRDARTRVTFEVRRRAEYFDFKPYLDLYRRAPRGKP